MCIMSDAKEKYDFLFTPPHPFPDSPSFSHNSSPSKGGSGGTSAWSLNHEDGKSFFCSGPANGSDPVSLSDYCKGHECIFSL